MENPQEPQQEQAKPVSIPEKLMILAERVTELEISMSKIWDLCIVYKKDTSGQKHEKLSSFAKRNLRGRLER